MGNKDFSDWNGRKRKLIVRPVIQPVKHIRAGKQPKPSFQTLVNRYKAARKGWLTHLERYLSSPVGGWYRGDRLWHSYYTDEINKMALLLHRAGKLEDVIRAVRSGR